MSRKINLRSSLQPTTTTMTSKSQFATVGAKHKPAQNNNPEQTLNISNIETEKYSFHRDSQKLPLEELMVRLSYYRDFKQLPINPVNQPKQKLWRDSPCTLRYVGRNISLDRTKKFQRGSIYFRDNVNQQKKTFSESQKPDLLQKNFQRQIKEANFSKYKQKSAGKNNENGKNTLLSLRKTMPLISQKLYTVPKKIELKYDRHGNRSNYEGDYDVGQIMTKLKSTRSNFTSSRRMDLGLPLNYYPGPGNYFDNPSNQHSQHHCQTFRTRLLNSNQNIQAPNSTRQLLQSEKSLSFIGENKQY